jgi:hypothetical protein
VNRKDVKEVDVFVLIRGQDTLLFSSFLSKNTSYKNKDVQKYDFACCFFMAVKLGLSH